jgi:hypothetical protein
LAGEEKPVPDVEEQADLEAAKADFLQDRVNLMIEKMREFFANNVTPEKLAEANAIIDNACSDPDNADKTIILTGPELGKFGIVEKVFPEIRDMHHHVFSACRMGDDKDVTYFFRVSEIVDELINESKKAEIDIRQLRDRAKERCFKERFNGLYRG